MGVELAADSRASFEVLLPGKDEHGDAMFVHSGEKGNEQRTAISFSVPKSSSLAHPPGRDRG
jgi:hypothetical protein